MNRLGTKDGLDEVSPCAPTRVSELTASGEVVERTITPEEFGIERLDPRALAGGDAADNAQAIVTILAGGHFLIFLATVFRMWEYADNGKGADALVSAGLIQSET